MNEIDNAIDQKYDEFVELLEILCRCYDESGKDIIALSISTAIRVLLHDTTKSTSLLSHLGKKNIKFLSTNTIANKTDHVHLGLVRRINIGVHNGFGGESKYWPSCDERYFPSHSDDVMLDQKVWWEEEIIFQSNQSSLTRRDLVLAMANKDGGAHFDSKVQRKYDDFRHEWSGGSSLVGTNSGKVRGYDNAPVRPAVRQIGYEVLCTLKGKH